MSQSSSDTVGLGNYVEKVNFRREGDVEVRREGWAPFPFQIFGNTYHNTAQTATNVCPEGYTGDPISVTIAANQAEYNSTVDQATANALALAAAQAAADALRELTPCVLFVPPPPPDFATNDYATMSGQLVSTTHNVIIAMGAPAFIGGAGGVPLASVATFTAALLSANYFLALVDGADAFVDGADGAPVGSATFTAALLSATYFLALVEGADAFVDGADGAPVGAVQFTAGLLSSTFFLVLVPGQPATVDGVNGAALGPVRVSASLISASYDLG